MKQVLSFLKTSFLGGALVVLPAWLALLLLLKALVKLEVLVKPVSNHLPPGIDHPMLVAALLMLLICFLVGVIVRTAVGREVKNAIESTVLEKVPGYTMLRGLAQQLGDLEGNRGFKPAMVEIEDGLAPCFIVEEHGDGKLTVFIPSAPTPAAGTILIVTSTRVHPLNVSVATVFKCITKWGTGSGALLAAMDQKTSAT